jgi:hypothetical protein
LVQRLDTEVGGLRPDQADRQVNVAITKRAQRFLLRRRPGGRAMDVFPLGRSEATSLTMRLQCDYDDHRRRNQFFFYVSLTSPAKISSIRCFIGSYTHAWQRRAHHHAT